MIEWSEDARMRAFGSVDDFKKNYCRLNRISTLEGVIGNEESIIGRKAIAEWLSVHAPHGFHRSPGHYHAKRPWLVVGKISKINGNIDGETRIAVFPAEVAGEARRQGTNYLGFRISSNTTQENDCNSLCVVQLLRAELDELREKSVFTSVIDDIRRATHIQISNSAEDDSRNAYICWSWEDIQQSGGLKTAIETLLSLLNKYIYQAGVAVETADSYLQQIQESVSNAQQYILFPIIDQLREQQTERNAGMLESESSDAEKLRTRAVIKTSNLILHGPPGTGKTYATAQEAVKLCGEIVPEARSELIDVYRRLVAEGRIEFVTFHQSVSYEEFIEGRQPMTGTDDNAENSSLGFRLETVPGIFRRIAKRAEASRGRKSVRDAIVVAGRQVFKMSIGRANNDADASFFNEAIAGGYTLLGWENIDWTDPVYADATAILEACQQHGQRQDDGELNLQSGQVQHTDVFRNQLKVGDIVIVSKGNRMFRAIGEVTGGYQYVPRPEGRYCHRRQVRWLWIDRDGVPVSEIYESNFVQPTIYRLRPEGLNNFALERYMNSGLSDAHTEAEAFVLVIDEINRANISKVFGELITLLEPDKRLGQDNELTVRLPYSGDKFGLPPNLHIVGTMNTADRSIALLDTALRRRFTFREIMPDPNVLENDVDGINLQKLLRVINDRIEYLFDREHQIGHAYFMNCETAADVEEVMRHKVIPLLAEYFYEDWSKVAAVLGDMEQVEPRFLVRERISPPLQLESASGDRFRWRVKPEKFNFSEFYA